MWTNKEHILFFFNVHLHQLFSPRQQCWSCFHFNQSPAGVTALTGSELFVPVSVAFLFGAARETVFEPGHSRTAEEEQHRSTGDSSLTRVLHY